MIAAFVVLIVVIVALVLLVCWFVRRRRARSASQVDLGPHADVPTTGRLETASR